MRYGIDCASVSPDPRQLLQRHFSFIVRYLSYPGNPKNLTKAEAELAHKYGVDVVTVFESTGTRARDGYAAGVQDAKAAEAQLHSLGAPVGVVVYFAVDYDPAGNSHLTDPYFDGAASVLGKARVGVYGGYEVIARQGTRGYEFLWQTYAWSGWPTTKWYPKAQLRQYSNDHTVLGVGVDLNQALTPNFGQWFYVPPVKKPSPKPHKITLPKILKKNKPAPKQLGRWKERPTKIRPGYRVEIINGWYWEVKR